MRRSVVFGVCFILIIPFFLLFLALADIGVSSLQAFRIFGYPSSNRNFLINVRDPWQLNADGGRIIFSGNLKFRHGFYAGIDFENLPETFDATIDVNSNFLLKLNPEFDFQKEDVSKTADGFFLKFWNFGDNAKNLISALQTKDVLISPPLRREKKYDSDFLEISVENTSGIPTDKYFFKRFTYNVEIFPPNDAYATLRVHLLHAGLQALPWSSVYVGKLRVKIPLGAEVLEKNSDAEFTEPDSHIFEKNLEILPGRSVVYSFRYKLPQKFLENENYRLFIRKQPSSEWQYQTLVKIPEDFDLESENLEVREFTAFKNDFLNTDRFYEVKWRPTKTPLSLVKASLRNRDEIVLEFNRILAGGEAADGLNYTITDTNEIHPEITDQVLTRATLFEGKTVRLKIAGMSLQPGEKYLVAARNIQDRYGQKMPSGILRVELNQ